MRDLEFIYKGILRDWNRDPYLCYSSKEGIGEVQEQELRANELGLRIRRQLQKKRITIVSYSRLAIQIIKKKIREHWQRRNIMRRIHNLCTETQSQKIVLVFCEANKVADWLATRECPRGYTCYSGPLEPPINRYCNTKQERNLFPQV